MSFGCLALFVTPIGVLASLGSKSLVIGWLWLAAAALGPFLLYLRWLICDHYVVNFPEKTIDHVQVFRGIAALNIQPTETRNKFRNFEQLHSLVLNRYSTRDKSPGQGYSYQVLLDCQDGQILMWADVGRNLEAGKRLGNRFAEKMGIPFDPSDASAPIQIKRNHQGIEVCRERTSWFNLRRFWSDGDGKKPDADSKPGLFHFATPDLLAQRSLGFLYWPVTVGFHTSRPFNRQVNTVVMVGVAFLFVAVALLLHR